MIVPYEVKATAGQTPALPAPIWTFNDSGVAAYARAPSVGGGIGVEHLDFDMRPDFGSYAGFVAWLGPDCGLKTCPGRMTGPKLYLHGLADGTFSEADETARSALKRACATKPGRVVVEAGGALNLTQTAKNLVCARAHSVESASLAAELAEKHAALCGEASKCAVETALVSWLELPLPLTFGSAAPSAKK